MCARGRRPRDAGPATGSPCAPVGPLVHHRLPRLRAHPGVLDNRRQVDLVHVLVPVDGAGIELEAVVVDLVERAPELHQVVDPVAGVGLGVRAVELDVAQSTFGEGMTILNPGGQLRLCPPDRQGSEQLLRKAHHRVGPPQLSLDPTPAGERPFGHADGLAALVVERVPLEEVGRQLDQSSVAQRVPHSRGHVVHLRRSRLGPACRHGQDGRHHQIDGDDVHDPLGDAGELTQQAARVRHDDRLRHAEAADPARAGLGDGGLNDRRAHEGDGHPALPLLDECPLAERLGEGVGVRPARGTALVPCPPAPARPRPTPRGPSPPAPRSGDHRPPRSRRGPSW